MRSVPILLALILLAPVPSDGYGINIELDTELGDRSIAIEAFRKKVGPDFKQGIHERITVEAIDAADRLSPFLDKHLNMKTEVTVGILFNDDPAGYLFPRDDGNENGYHIIPDSGETAVSGFKWLAAFARAVARTKEGNILQWYQEVGMHVEAGPGLQAGDP